MTQLPPIRLAVIGAGFSRQAHVPALKKLSAHLEVVAVFSRKTQNAEALAGHFGRGVRALTSIEALLDLPGVEAVDVALPIGLAEDTVERALNRGFHVFSEKPIAATVARGVQLLQVYEARKPPVIWCVAENLRFTRHLEKVRGLIEDGEIGEMILCHAPTFVPIRGTPWFKTDWRRAPAYAGGFLLDGGVHDIAALRFVLGNVAEVSAYTRAVEPNIPPMDSLVCAMRFESGVIASHSVSYALEMPALTLAAKGVGFLSGALWRIRDRFGGRWHFLGTRGSIFVAAGTVELVRGIRRFVFKIASNAIHDEFLEFAEAVREGKPLRNSPKEGLNDIAVAEAMLESSNTRAAVCPRVFR